MTPACGTNARHCAVIPQSQLGHLLVTLRRLPESGAPATASQWRKPSVGGTRANGQHQPPSQSSVRSCDTDRVTSTGRFWATAEVSRTAAIDPYETFAAPESRRPES